MPLWFSWQPWGCGTSSSASRRTSAVWAICLSTRSIRWGSAVSPGRSETRAPPAGFSPLGLPRLSGSLMPTSSLVFFRSWRLCRPSPPHPLPSPTLCVLSTMGCQVDGSLKHPPGPPRSSPLSLRSLPGPRPQVQILRTPRAHPTPPHS